jgi:hypothetical protein
MEYSKLWYLITRVSLLRVEAWPNFGSVASLGIALLCLFYGVTICLFDLISHLVVTL